MPSLDQRLLERLGRGMAVGLQQQLGSVGILGRDHGQPPVLAERDLGLLHEAEDFGVEPQRLVLVVDEDAGEVDPHGLLSVRSGLSHRSRCARAVAVSRSWNL